LAAAPLSRLHPQHLFSETSSLAADYDDGTYFHDTYDAVGNRRTEVTQVGSTTYDYDNANRLTSIGATTHTWDNNGSLLNDGVSTHTYDKANRLASVV